MKRALAIVCLGLLVAVTGYCALYYSQTKSVRSLQAASELAWLKMEFGLEEGEFARIEALHEGYLPQCAAMCAKIAAANAELESMVVQTNTVTPEIRAKLGEIGNLRQECQAQMLNHFYAVSQAMPAEQGRRYLAEMQKMTSLSNMRDHSVSTHSEHGH
jgi:hypothetical protein